MFEKYFTLHEEIFFLLLSDFKLKEVNLFKLPIISLLTNTYLLEANNFYSNTERKILFELNLIYSSYK